MDISVSINKRIQFYDLDPMNIVWHGNYIKYFEEARCVLLDAIDYNYIQMKESGYMWPVIDVQVRYVGAIRFLQEITITAKLVDWQNGMEIQYTIHDVESGKRLTKGKTRQVAVDMQNNDMQIISPQILFDKIAAYQNAQ